MDIPNNKAQHFKTTRVMSILILVKLFVNCNSFSPTLALLILFILMCILHCLMFVSFPVLCHSALWLLYTHRIYSNYSAAHYNYIILSTVDSFAVRYCSGSKRESNRKPFISYLASTLLSYWTRPIS